MYNNNINGNGIETDKGSAGKYKITKSQIIQICVLVFLVNLGFFLGLALDMWNADRIANDPNIMGHAALYLLLLERYQQLYI